MLGLETRFITVELENQGGLPMPVILEAHYTDGSTEEVRVPAEIWRSNRTTVTKLIIADKDIAKVVLDPHSETADADTSDNVWPPEIGSGRIELRPNRRRGGSNPMREEKEEVERMKRKTPDIAAGAQGEESEGDAGGDDDNR